MKFNSSTFKSIVFVSAIIGLCQSVIWIVLTICAILTFRCVLPIPQYDTDHFIVTTIVKFYFEGEECKVVGEPPGYHSISEVNLTKPVEVFSWMIAFLVISLIHLLSSALLLKRRRGKNIRSVLRDWCFVSLAIVVMDAVLAGIFISDYIALEEHLEKYKEKDDEGLAAAPAAMFIIAAKGFALWMVDVGFLIYFSLTTSCFSSEKMEEDEKQKDNNGFGRANGAFEFSSDTLTRRRVERSDPASYDASQEMTFYPVMQQHTPLSVSSFEAVTRFNEPENLETPAKKQQESNGFGCNCPKWTDELEGTSQGHWRSKVYHSHGCPALRSELEQKLATIRGSDGQVLNRTKKIPDFSHDIRNFKPGGDQENTKASPHYSRLQGASNVPAAANCDNSSFY